MLRELPPDVVALLARQHGVATSAQLRAAGMTARQRRLGVHRGLLLHPYRGVYVDRPAWREASEAVRHAMRLLAVQLVASDAVGVGTTAALTSQLPVRRPPRRPEVARSGGRTGLAGADVRRTPVRPEDVVEVEGLFVTSIPATCAAIAAASALPDALITLDGALRRGVGADQLLDAAGRLSHAAQRRRAERAIGLADPWSESWLESLSRGQAIEIGLPAPLCNVTIIAGGREVRVDELWAEWCVVGEADGKGKYELRPDVAEAHWQEKQRREWVEDLGFEVARWGFREVSRDGATLRSRVERAFARQARTATGWPDGARAELRTVPGVEPPSRVVAELDRLQSLDVPIRFAPPDPWRAPEHPGSLWTPVVQRTAR